MNDEPIYLDYNATTPIDPQVAEAMSPFLHGFFGNPSSAHTYGRQARNAIEKARAQVSDLIGCSPLEIVFTSGATEANNMTVKGVAEAYRKRGDHIVTSAVEHPAVLESCRYLESQGFRLTEVPVDEHGTVDPDSVERAITEDTILVTIMHANNEVGTIQVIGEIASIAHRHGALFHTDAAQSVGKIPVDVTELGVDLLSIAGHKFYAPKGVGALFVRPGVELGKFMHGAPHEANRRAGTENVLQIVGFGKAAEIAFQELESRGSQMQARRDQLWEGLKRAVEDPLRIKLNGHPENRLPNTLNVSFHSIEANTLLAQISEQVAASPGAACHAECIDVSHVLTAMNVPVEYAMGAVRFSVGKFTTEEQVDIAVEVVSKALQAYQS